MVNAGSGTLVITVHIAGESKMTDGTAKTWNETYQKLIVSLKKEVKNLNNRIQALIEFDSIKTMSFNYALTIIQDLLDNSDEYARQRAMDFLKEVKGDNS